jgi:hypothetical protein
MVATKHEGPAVGIDLGTTYSCVAVWLDDQNRVEIIHNDQGNRITPSFVAFTDDQRLIGDAAKNQTASNPTNTVFGKFLYSLIYCYVSNVIMKILISVCSSVTSFMFLGFIFICSFCSLNCMVMRDNYFFSQMLRG